MSKREGRKLQSESDDEVRIQRSQDPQRKKLQLEGPEKMSASIEMMMDDGDAG